MKRTDGHLDVVERYIHDVVNARRALAEHGDRDGPLLAQTILSDIALYLADHVEDVRSVQQRLASRDDRDARAMLACIDLLLKDYAAANQAAKAVLSKAMRAS